MAQGGAATPGGLPPPPKGAVHSAEIEYALGSSMHRLTIVQSGGSVTGVHQGETVGGDLQGSVHGAEAQFRSHHAIQGTSIGYEFTGVVDGNKMSGDVSMGEYGSARWTATRQA